jgi:hypothetical protein
MSNFIPASPGSFISQINNSELLYEDVDRYLSQSTPALLHCVFENISTEKSIYKLTDRVQGTLDKLNEKFPSNKIWLDSAGFQISNGKFNKNILDDYIDIYYDTCKNVSGYERNFVLDMPPSKIFKSYDEVRKLNDISYKTAQYNNNGRSIFVFHAHDWELYKIWTELFDKYSDGFDKFSIGGVASGNLGSLDRIVVYALLFRTIIEKCIQTKRDTLQLHILGAGRASGTLCLLFRLMTDFVEQHHNIKINLTTDSAQHLRISQGRKFTCLCDDGIIYTLDWFSKNLNNNFKGKTMENYIKNEITRFANTNDINCTVSSLYNDDGKTNMTSYVLMCLYDIHNYIQTQEIISDNLSDLISTYNSTPDLFFDKIIKVVKRLSGGRITNNIRRESAMIIKFLSILKDRDLIRVEGLLKMNTEETFRNILKIY